MFLLFSTLQEMLLQQLLFYNSSSRQSILTRAQIKLDEGAFPTNTCVLHKKQWILVMDAESQPEPHLLQLINMHVTFDLLEIEQTTPQQTRKQLAAGDDLL